jgi:hypothetical protein
MRDQLLLAISTINNNNNIQMCVYIHGCHAASICASVVCMLASTTMAADGSRPSSRSILSMHDSAEIVFIFIYLFWHKPKFLWCIFSIASLINVCILSVNTTATLFSSVMSTSLSPLVWYNSPCVLHQCLCNSCRIVYIKHTHPHNIPLPHRLV